MNTELTKLIYENEKLIYSFIKQYDKYIDKEDLYQVGVIGLINAYKNFKNDMGVKFSTYAYKYIQGEIKKYVRENRTFKINKDISTLCIRVKKAKNILEQKFMKEPTIKDLSKFLEMDENQVEFVLGIEQNVQSLDNPITTDKKELTLYEIIPNKETLTQLDKLHLNEQLSKLNYKEKRILLERYYLDKTQREVASTLGMTQVKVSREEKRVLQKLKSSMIA